MQASRWFGLKECPSWLRRCSSNAVQLSYDGCLSRRAKPRPGTATHFHRVTVVLRRDALAIEYRDGSPTQRIELRPGQVDWDEPTDRIHRGVNVGQQPYQEITVFFLDHPDAVPQPTDD